MLNTFTYIITLNTNELSLVFFSLKISLLNNNNQVTGDSDCVENRGSTFFYYNLFLSLL